MCLGHTDTCHFLFTKLRQGSSEGKLRETIVLKFPARGFMPAGRENCLLFCHNGCLADEATIVDDYDKLLLIGPVERPDGVAVLVRIIRSGWRQVGD